MSQCHNDVTFAFDIVITVNEQHSREGQHLDRKYLAHRTLATSIYRTKGSLAKSKYSKLVRTTSLRAKGNFTSHIRRTASETNKESDRVAFVDTNTTERTEPYTIWVNLHSATEK